MTSDVSSWAGASLFWTFADLLTHLNKAECDEPLQGVDIVFDFAAGSFLEANAAWWWAAILPPVQWIGSNQQFGQYPPATTVLHLLPRNSLAADTIIDKNSDGAVVIDCSTITGIYPNWFYFF